MDLPSTCVSRFTHASTSEFFIYNSPWKAKTTGSKQKSHKKKLKFINMPKDVLPTDGYLVSTIQCVVYYVQHKVIQTSSISNQLFLCCTHKKR
jgi:hypothetical protein